MRGIIAVVTVTLFFSWVSEVNGQDLFEIVPVKRTITVSASCNGTVSDELNVGAVYLERSCSARAGIDTWGSPSGPDEPVSAASSITISTYLVPNVVELSATSHFDSGYFTGLGSSFFGDASVVFSIPCRMEPTFAFTPIGFADCSVTLSGPSGDVWRGVGTGIAQIRSESERPRVLDPGQYTLSMHIEPRVTVGVGGDGGMSVNLSFAPAIPEPVGMGVMSLGMLLLTRWIGRWGGTW
ncbi:MAG: hypothetical protein ACM359_05940 [Bacillota bacterium]